MVGAPGLQNMQDGSREWQPAQLSSDAAAGGTLQGRMMRLALCAQAALHSSCRKSAASHRLPTPAAHT